MNTSHKIAVIGLGYVGLPLARLFATKYPVVGFDINTDRIKKLNEGIDDTLELSTDLLKSVLKNENPFCHSELVEEAKKINRVVSVGKNANLENRNFCILRKSRLFKNKTKIFKIYFGVKYIVIDSMEMVKKC